jgi:thiamine biosynthesis protein ThiS
MKLRLNGKEYEHKGDGTLGGLLAELKANADHVAAMVNDRIIPKSERGAFGLKEGDAVEVLTFMGGG